MMLGPGAHLLPIEELEDFWDFFYKRSVSRVSGLGNRHVTLRTLLSNAKKFKGGFIRRGTRISEEFTSEINQVNNLLIHFLKWILVSQSPYILLFRLIA